ncbi:MAG: (d)CMP kinase [Puniceicoccaceae bacterium]|nr:MAG: (d)CMP kinase [Puniceicoccaceae bacterium]
MDLPSTPSNHSPGRLPVVAIDGGAASGKSTTAQALARMFHLLHVDTGSHYRALTHCLLQAKVAPEDEAAVNSALGKLSLGTRVDGHEARIEIDGHVFGDELRGEAINQAVSRFAALPAVRSFLLPYQRGLAGTAAGRGFRGLAMEGRDIGSVIFPDAPFRLFLEADPTTRARRRAGQGQTDTIGERDRLDSSRATAPLVRPPGATVIDTTHLTLGEVVEAAAEILRQGGLAPAAA